MLHVDEYGDGHGGDAGGETAPTLLIAHGLFGSARNWRAIAKRLSRKMRVLAVDMRNHGSSPFTDDMDYPGMAADLAEVIESRVSGPAMVLGHSMGGKAVMVLALTRPELVSRLLVADIAPVGYGHTQLPVIEAMEAVDLGSITRRADGDAALADHIDEPGLRAFLLQSLSVEDGSPARWRLNLSVLRKDMDKIIGFPDISGTYAGPTLFLSGAESDYMSGEGRDRARGLFPNARYMALKGAGHWLHADQPRAFIETTDAFMTPK